MGSAWGSVPQARSSLPFHIAEGHLAPEKGILICEEPDDFVCGHEVLTSEVSLRGEYFFFFLDLIIVEKCGGKKAFSEDHNPEGK